MSTNRRPGPDGHIYRLRGDGCIAACPHAEHRHPTSGAQRRAERRRTLRPLDDETLDAETLRQAIIRANNMANRHAARRGWCGAWESVLDSINRDVGIRMFKGRDTTLVVEGYVSITLPNSEEDPESMQAELTRVMQDAVNDHLAERQGQFRATHFNARRQRENA